MAEDTREFFGSNVLIEQRFAPVKPVQRFGKDRSPMLNKSGKPKTFNVPHKDANGKPIWGWVVYRKTKVIGKVHPFTGEQTSLPFVWMPAGEFDTRDEARQLAQQLSGG